MFSVNLNNRYDVELLNPFNGLFSRTTWVSQHQKGKPSGFYWSKRWWGGSDVSWTICKSFAPCSRHASTPPLSFYRPDALPAMQPTASKHWRNNRYDVEIEKKIYLWINDFWPCYLVTVKRVICECVVLASSGIDYDIKLWMPVNEQPQFDEASATEVSSSAEILLALTHNIMGIPQVVRFH